jgi:hypothetical protein
VSIIESYDEDLRHVLTMAGKKKRERERERERRERRERRDNLI